MIRILFSLFLTSLLAGCSPSSQSNKSDNNTSEKQLDDFNFVAELTRKQAATVSDMIRITSIGLKKYAGEHSQTDWRAVFIRLGWMHESSQDNDLLNFGQLGMLLSGRCHLRGNLLLKTFGPSERYGFREITHLNFVRGGKYPNQHVSGSVLMNAVSAATAHVKKFDSEAQKEYNREVVDKLKGAFQ